MLVRGSISKPARGAFSGKSTQNPFTVSTGVSLIRSGFPARLWRANNLYGLAASADATSTNERRFN